mgnify:CR=1 FL=1
MYFIKNAISLKDLTKICQKITLNRIKISSKKNTSEYDIPYYITDNSKVKKIYKWVPKKKIFHIIQDMYKWMSSNKKALKKYIIFNKISLQACHIQFKKSY